MKSITPIFSLSLLNSLTVAWVQIYQDNDNTSITPDQVEKDAEGLLVAMKLNRGTDEAQLIEILGSKKSIDRDLIAAKFQNKYNKTLVETLKQEKLGDFGRVLRLSAIPLVDAEVMMLHDAFDGEKYSKWAGTAEQHLYGILLGRKTSELNLLKNTYILQSEYSLEDKIHQDTSGDLKSLLLACIDGNQQTFDHTVHTQDRVTADVQMFYDATENYHSVGGYLRLGTNGKTLGNILCHSPAQHLVALNTAYEQQHSKSLATVIKEETKLHFRKAALFQLNMQIDPLTAIRDQFEDALDGLGTDEHGLMNLVLRYQSSMGKIMTADPSIRAKIQNGTRHNLQRMLLKLVDHTETHDFNQFEDLDVSEAKTEGDHDIW